MEDPSKSLRSSITSKDWYAAVSFCERNEKDLSDTEKVYFIRSLYELKKYDECIKTCDRYFPLSDRNNLSLMKFKLRSLRKSDNTEAAKILAEEMANQSPIIQEAYLFLVRFHMNYGDIEAAKSWCSKLLKEADENLEGLRLYARIIDKTSADHAERLLHWERLLTLHPEDEEARFKSSRELVRLNQINEAKGRIPSSGNSRKFTREIIKLSKVIRESSDAMPLLDSVKECYFSEDFDSGLKLIKSKKNLSNTEKIWKIRLLEGKKQSEKIRYFWKTENNSEMHVNVCLAFAQAFLASDFHSECISSLRSASTKTRSEKEALRCISLLFKSRAKTSQVLEILDLIADEFVDSISEEIIIQAALNDRSDLMAQPRFFKRYISDSSMGNLVFQISTEQFDFDRNLSIDPSLLIKLPMPFLISLDSKLPRKAQQLSIDEAIISGKLDGKTRSSVIKNRLFRYSEEGNIENFSTTIGIISFIEKALSSSELQRIFINLSSAGFDPSNFLHKIGHEMEKKPEGSINFAVAAFRTGFTELGLDFWKNALVRYVSDPENERSFPLKTWATGRMDIISELYERLFIDPESLFLKLYTPELQQFCTNVEAMKQILDEHSPFQISETPDENLLEVSLLSQLSNLRVNSQFSPEIGKVMHVTNSVRIGGAERQVIFSLKTPEIETELALFNISRNNEENSFISELNKLDIRTHDFSEESKLEIDDTIQEIVNLIPEAPSLNPWMGRQILSLADIFSKSKPEIVHLWQDGTNIIAGVAALMAGVPRIILSARSIPPFRIKGSKFPDKGTAYFLNNRFTRKMYEVLMRHDNIDIIFNSQVCSEYYIDWIGLESEVDRSRVIFNAVDLKKFSPQDPKIKKTEKIVGGVFRLKEVKRPLLWLEVAHYIHENFRGKVRFIILGDGPMLDICKKRIKEKGLSEFVELKGFSDEVEKLLPSFDLLLQTSEIEGLPNTLIEAQACGVPVVTTDAGGSRETLIDGVTGFVSKGDGVREIGDLALRAISDDNWIDDAKRTSVRWARNNFGKDIFYRKLLELYGVSQ